MTIEEIPQPPAPEKPTAIRWMRNGDHPGDRVGEELTNEIGETYRRVEGAVVRFFRHPKHPGGQEHNGPGGCYKPWHEHGWIDSGGDGQVVCPGDLIVSRPPDAFEVLKLGRSTVRDRCDNYVPAGLYLRGREQYVEVSPPRPADVQWLLNTIDAADRLFADITNNPAMLELLRGQPEAEIGRWRKRIRPDWPLWSGMPRPAKVARWAHGDPDELNPEHGSWEWADVSGDGTHWSHFNGHRVQVDVELHTSNDRDVNDWKGHDEIRAGGVWTISINRQQVWEGHVGRDVIRALAAIQRKVQWFLDGPHAMLDFGDPRPFSEQLVGRRVYYDRTPAVVSSTVLQQGCVILKPVGVNAFPRAAYNLDREPDGTGHTEQDSYDESEARTIKVEIDSPHIWWHRDRPFSPDESDGRYRPRKPNGEIEAGASDGRQAGSAVEVTVEDDE